ncbi:SIR2 family protein [Methylotenera sp. 1P/1]|uniref:SIR2 family protein n=1 Tax=Methylotenera sp. 1P/1 TaxID=1131551 RepID=UPI00036B1D2F|nr:SIR2 family protein [Methylotenera sp. 1P/1]
MSENVIVLGAGFSYDAGIPLLGNFIERMWEYSIRGKAGSVTLNYEEQKILQEALKIRSEMDGYHGRVAFDDRNIEDILSMLAFNLMEGKTSDRNKLNTFISAISTTIELACNVNHPGIPNDGRYSAISEGNEVYRSFWKALFKRYKEEKTLPTIITFNYDLVLERSLFQVLINKNYNDHSDRCPFKALKIDYQYPYFPAQQYLVEYTTYGYGSDRGTVIKPYEFKVDECASIEILKLHGSLNFPNSKSKSDSLPLSPTGVIDSPYILPPVSNKQSNGNGNQTWKTALQRLREAKNVIFVGYSLPKTDMYMQFFLKAALGPNQELNRLFIFDPVLWKNTAESEDMKRRYEMCFSEQLRNRIVFNPEVSGGFAHRSSGNLNGTTAHFVNTLEDEPNKILF